MTKDQRSREVVSAFRDWRRDSDAGGRALYLSVLEAVSADLGVTLEYAEQAATDVGPRGEVRELPVNVQKLTSSLRAEPSLLDELYAVVVGRDRRQEDGQFFTPPQVAKFMAGLLSEAESVLDPAVGPGIFPEYLLQSENLNRLILNDVDPVMLCATELRVSLLDSQDVDVVLRNEDYVTATRQNSVDAVVCNPPYNRFQNHENERVSELEDELGVSLGGFSNSYPLFLLRSIAQVEQGRVVFITPSEFLDTAYGTDLKHHLLNDVDLRAVISLQWDEDIFDALTTAAITVVDTSGETDQVTFAVSKDPSELEQVGLEFPESLSNLESQIRSVGSLDPSEKWGRHCEADFGRQYLDATVPLGDIADITRGIATGHNEFFTMTAAEVEEWEVEERFRKPALTKAAQAPNYTFTEADFERLYQTGHNVQLLYVQDPPSETLNEYLQYGKETHEAHERYLTANRTPWYSPEERDPSPILATVFSRENMRFVYNEAEVLNLAAFHCVYPVFDGERATKALLGYLNSNLALRLAKAKQRRYADGLGKFEPGDLSEIPVLDVRRLSSEEQTKLATAFERLDRAARKDEGSQEEAVEAELDQLVQQLLEKYRHVDNKEKITAWTDSDR